MNIFYASAIAIVIFCLLYLRARVIYSALIDWNYYVYRYERHCALNYHQDKPLSEIRSNEVNRAEAIMVFLMFWKINTNYFFDYKLDWEEIYDLYIINANE